MLKFQKCVHGAASDIMMMMMMMTRLKNKIAHPPVSIYFNDYGVVAVSVDDDGNTTKLLSLRW